MFKNHLKIAFRNIVRNKLYTFINVFGLAISIAVSILIYLYLHHELTYDHYHENYERIYRVASERLAEDGTVEQYATSEPGLARHLKENSPEIEDAIRIGWAGRPVIRNKERVFNQENFYFASSNFFDFFSYKFLQGDPKTAINEPQSIVLAKKLADKLFGDEDPLGKTIEIPNMGGRFNYGKVFKITGVIEDIPQNSHFQFEAIIYMDPKYPDFATYSYIRLQEGITKAAFNKRWEGHEFTGLGEGQTLDIPFHIILQPIKDIHLHSHLRFEAFPNGNIYYIYMFSIALIFIMIIACINYMNLSTARSINRAKEIGIRKVLGAGRPTLIFQFLIESILLTSFATLIALALVEILLPYFNQILAKQFVFDLLENGRLLLLITGGAVLLGIIAGSYPAFVMSAFEPIRALKHKIPIGNNAVSIRKILVIVQFTVSIIMIISSLLINNQLDFILNKDLGFDKKNILILYSVPAKLKQAFTEELLQNPNIQHATITPLVPFIDQEFFIPFRISDSERSEEISMNHLFADYGYIELMGMEIIMGRSFDRSLVSDQEYSYVINETAAKRAGWDNPVGMKMEKLSDWGTDTVQPGRIIGVVKDFHTRSLHDPIDPVALSVAKNPWGRLYLKLSGDNLKETMEFIEKKYKEFAPDRGFKHRIMEDDYNTLATEEAQLNKLFKYFSILTIIIACLGLFGLSSHSIQQRTKEIGIRKVIGASVSQIVMLLSKDFTKLVLISILLACPIAYYSMDIWLQNFAYRTQLSWISFFLAGIAALVIALSTICFHALRAANANPIKALRDE